MISDLSKEELAETIHPTHPFTALRNRKITKRSDCMTIPKNFVRREIKQIMRKDKRILENLRKI